MALETPHTPCGWRPAPLVEVDRGLDPGHGLWTSLLKQPHRTDQVFNSSHCEQSVCQAFVWRGPVPRYVYPVHIHSDDGPGLF